MKTRTYNPKLAWTHHPRGGIVTGYASRIKRNGLYGPERTISSTAEGAREGNGMSFPASQVYFTQPPQ